MNFELLVQNSSLSIFRDKPNGWLYLDWYGDLTLRTVKHNCILAAKCFRSQDCSRILNDNTNVTSITPDVGHWLATEYLPYMEGTGVEYMAWVHSANIDTQVCTDAALGDLLAPVVALFNDVATAYGWLRAVKFKAPVSTMPITTMPLFEMSNHLLALRPHL